MRCPNADTEMCTHPACRCFKPMGPLEPPIDVRATKTLGDYIQRVVEAEKGLPEPVTVDRKVLQQCADALTWSNPYIAAILQQALDKPLKA